MTYANLIELASRIKANYWDAEQRSPYTLTLYPFQREVLNASLREEFGKWNTGVTADTKFKRVRALGLEFILA